MTIITPKAQSWNSNHLGEVRGGFKNSFDPKAVADCIAHERIPYFFAIQENTWETVSTAK